MQKLSQSDFEAIYANGGWDGMGSGPGSTPTFTEGFRKVLEEILKKYYVRSVLDIGCGD